ncbi:TadE/TadG family type IV pilus assembly protein [Granulicella arctica]|uniref:TadE/TadG family type IV pilus assembly protein n=1 Tax=Granulicella arctica TaxID=940613 RepID=UPI0021E007EC|nr:TadE/TadG family type IV pilus assembly protein [Granulicella arctica]
MQPLNRDLAPAPSQETILDRLRAFLSGKEDSGQSLIEFAVCLPVLLLIVTGIMTFGIGINNFIMLTEATSVGARQLAIIRGQDLDPCANVAKVVYAAAPNLTASGLTFSFVLNGTPYAGNSCASTSATSGSSGNMVQGSSARLTVTYPCNLAVYGINYAPSCTLKAQTAELVQ